MSREFEKLVEKHFKKDTLAGKLFNRNNLKVSYCCTRNIKTLIAAHNQKVLSGGGGSEERDRDCNCRGGRGNCPAGGSCQVRGVVYQAEVAVEGEESKWYIGAAATTLKERISNHKKDFNNRKYEHCTTLSAYVWKVKDRGKTPTVKFTILVKARPYNPVSRRCNLCTMEKLLIAQCDESKFLNRRSEVVGKCRHRNKWVLASW